MTRTMPRCGLVLLLALLSAPVAADQDEAAVLFEILFEPEVRKAKATTGYTDNLALATEFMKAAAGERDSYMIEVLCHNAHELAHRTPKGYALSVEALETIKKHNPHRVGECDEKILAIRRKQYTAVRPTSRTQAAADLARALIDVADAKAAAGDHVEAVKLIRQAITASSSARLGSLAHLHAKLKRWLAVVQVTQQIRLCESKLRSNPKDERTRSRLARLHLVDKNDPAAAAKHLTPESDETLRTYVPLAAKKPADLAPVVCVELGEWYFRLSQTASAAAKGAMLTRARDFLRSFVARTQTADATVIKARLQLARIEGELKKHAGPPAPRP